jgi:hypothetical protein
VCLEARIGAVKNLKLLTFLPFTAARTRKIMVFVWAAREQVLASRSCSPATGKEMARAHNALATYEVTREVGDGVEFAGEKFKRRLIKHMDKGALRLHVTDREWHEALGGGVDVAFAL